MNPAGFQLGSQPKTRNPTADDDFHVDMLASLTMWRHLYSIVLTALLPTLVWHVIRKYRAQGEPVHLWSRLGGNPPHIRPGAIWIHACSLGEAKVALRLAESIEDQNPNATCVFTATTPAGTAYLSHAHRAPMIFPWDLPWVWDAWLAQSPAALVVIETELWPNLIARCQAHQVPVVLANGRLSPKSFRRYQRISRLSKPMWAALSGAYMQAAEDAARAKQLGVPSTVISEVGSIKLDHVSATAQTADTDALRTKTAPRRLAVLMSSHAQDEIAVLDALDWSDATHPRLLIVPRHPHRGSEIRQACAKRTLSAAQLSEGLPETETDIWIGDTFGRMVEYLSVADVVIIGGSFSGRGGQNPVEPASLAKPMLAGASMYNFQTINDALEGAGALKRVHPSTLSDGLVWAESADAVEGARLGQQWIYANQGSSEHQARLIHQLISASNRSEMR
jgi:3-deoxy-D-manno-octulosonic-acid transferase